MSDKKSLTVCVVYAREDKTEKGELINRLGTLNSVEVIGEPIDIQTAPKDGRPVYLWKQDNDTWENEEQKGAWDEVQRELEEAIDSSLALAYYNRGAAYLSLGAQDDKREFYTKAISDFGTVIALSPGSAVVYLNRGIAYSYRKDVTEKDYDSASKDFVTAGQYDKQLIATDLRVYIAYRIAKSFSKREDREKRTMETNQTA